MAIGEKPCKDCVAQWAAGHSTAAKPRPAPHPGPRCTTHHRAFKRAQKARNHDAMVTRTYELGPGDYERLYAYQGGVCAICRKAKGIVKRLAVDHNHRTNHVRGLLCGPCNQFIGRVGDNPEVGTRMAAYLADDDRDVLESIKAST